MSQPAAQESQILPIGFALWKTHTLWRQHTEKALGAMGLTHAQFLMLISIDALMRHEQIPTQSAIAQIVHMDKNTVSQVLRILERKSYINRVTPEEDTRVRIATLSALGKQKLSRALHVTQQVDATFFGVLKDTQWDFHQCLQYLVG